MPKHKELIDYDGPIFTLSFLIRNSNRWVGIREICEETGDVDKNALRKVNRHLTRLELQGVVVKWNTNPMGFRLTNFGQKLFGVIKDERN